MVLREPGLWPLLPAELICPKLTQLTLCLMMLSVFSRASASQVALDFTCTAVS